MAEIKKISTELQLLDKFLDTSGDAGTSGQVLTSTGTGVNWVSGGSLPGGPYLPLAGGTLTGGLTGTSVTMTGGIKANQGMFNNVDGLRLINPGGGSSVGQNSTVTGAIKITLPVSWTNTMMRMTIKVYEYTTNESFTLVCGGYNYTGNSSWINEFAYIESSGYKDRNFTVRMGHDGTKCCIYIGELTSTWTYPQVFVTDFQAGYSSYVASSWQTGWDVNFETSAFGTITHTETNPQINNWARIGQDLYYGSGTGNVGIGTAAPFTGITLGSTGSFGFEETATVNPDPRRWWINTDQIVYGDFRIATASAKQATTPDLTRLYINPSGNVGIGTTTPTTTTGIKLDVIGGIGAWAANNTSTLKLFNGRLVGAGRQITNLVSTNGNGSLELYRSDNLLNVLITGSGNSYLNGGNVGIGVTNPGIKLQLISADEQLTNFSSSVADQLAYSQINASSSTSGTITAAAALELVGKANGSGHGRHAWIGAEGTSNTTLLTKLKFKVRGQTASGYDWAGGSEAPTIMTLEGDGNVGMGTDSPGSKLHVKGDFVSIEDPSGGFKMELSADTDPVTIMSDNLTGAAYGQIAFVAGNGSGSNDQERMRIDSSGRVGINTTTTPLGTLNVVSNNSSIPTIVASGHSSGGSGTLQSWRYIQGSTSYRLDLAQQVSSGLVKYKFNTINDSTSYNNNLVLDRGNVGIGTDSPSGPFHVKVGTSTPLIVASSSYCNNVGIRTTTPTASLQVKGNVSYSYNNYTNVANTWINVINFSGYPAGLYQISIIKKTNASTYITAIVKWSATAGTVISTIASNQLGITFSGTQLQAISGIATGTLMSANLQCLVTNEDFCS